MAPSNEFDETEHFAFLAALDDAGTSRYFLSNILAVLQKTGTDSGLSWEELQQQLKPDIVHYLYESAKLVWERHPFDKINPDDDKEICGLYLGSMEPSIIRRGVAQALMYCDRIYVVDPFSIFLARGGDLSPLNVPQKYMFNAVLSIQEVLAVSPFVAEDLVRFVPTPDLFNPELFFAMQQLATQRLAKMPLQAEDYDEWASHKAPNFVRWLGTWSDEDLHLFRNRPAEPSGVGSRLG